MGRMIAAIVVGYIVMFVLVFATFTAAYLSLGADRSFRPGTYEVTGAWVVVSTVLSFAAAVVGGFLAAKIGRGQKAAVLLAVVVVVLGVVLAIPSLNAPRTDEVRPGDVSNADAMMKAQQPPAVTLVTPVIGAIGVLAGARLRKSK